MIEPLPRHSAPLRYTSGEVSSTSRRPSAEHSCNSASDHSSVSPIPAKWTHKVAARR